MGFVDSLYRHIPGLPDSSEIDKTERIKLKCSNFTTDQPEVLHHLCLLFWRQLLGVLYFTGIVST